MPTFTTFFSTGAAIETVVCTCNNDLPNNHYVRLPIKKQWRDMIREGIKKEEYRRMSPGNKRVFEKACKAIASDCEGCYLRLHNYSKDYTQVKCIGLKIGRGNPKWGAPTGEDVYIYQLDSNSVKDYIFV